MVSAGLKMVAWVGACAFAGTSLALLLGLWGGWLLGTGLAPAVGTVAGFAGALTGASLGFVSGLVTLMDE